MNLKALAALAFLVAGPLGAAEPVATNGSEQGRARNRRIEIRTLRSPPN